MFWCKTDKWKLQIEAIFTLNSLLMKYASIWESSKHLNRFYGKNPIRTSKFLSIPSELKKKLLRLRQILGYATTCQFTI